MPLIMKGNLSGHSLWYQGNRIEEKLTIEFSLIMLQGLTGKSVSMYSRWGIVTVNERPSISLYSKHVQIFFQTHPK